MQKTNAEKTIGATVTGSDGLLTFQARKKAPLFTPPEGGKQGPPSATPQMSHAALARSLANEETLTKETLTEIDQTALTATQLDQFLCGVEEETTRTVAIHVFARLTRNDHDYSVDIGKLSAQTGLSVRQVKRSLYDLVFTGKIRRLSGKKPRRYRLIKEAQHGTIRNTHRDT